ncbi:uncharacterized protein LOC100369222 [Saccoglossus kowalevskii]|uniref:Uncharacterized protein LOC100369222 n=1 Tax=Saccoglossus kowalevskii TaxID=10224 RepID=A0ABM0M7D1_SACKO|nr:PREDICTED: uncharacterized protein LOC100369222 [Saccoglossus kowalevskii]
MADKQNPSQVSATSLSKLKRSRNGNRSQMTKLLNKAEAVIASFELESTDKFVAIETLTSNQELIQERYDILKSLDERILELVEKDDIESTIEDSSDYLNDVYASEFKIQRLIERKRREPTNPSSPGTEETTPPTVSTPPTVTPSTSGDNTAQAMYFTAPKTISLPKLQLPTFNGNILQWVSFYDAFKSAVHSDSNLEDVQKFQYLRAQLTGEAARAIEGLQLTDSNYRHAIQILVDRYGQNHKIIAAYMKSLWEMPKPTGDLNSLRNFYDSLESYIRDLQSLGKREDSYGDLLVPIMLEKLPGYVRKQIAREHGNCEWKLYELREAIIKEIDALQADEFDREPPTEPPVTAAFYAGTSTEPQKPRSCAFCKGEHSPNNCKVVVDRNKRMEPTNSNSHANSPKTPNAASHTIETHVQFAKANFEDIPRELPTGPVLLKTAVIQISADYEKVHANVLFDEGATRSFITTELASKLGIKSIRSEVIHLAAFGDKNSRARSLEVATLTLHTITGANCDINALIVPEISTLMKNFVTPSIRNLPHLRGLKLAQPVSSIDSFTVSLLIGADFYWDVVEDHVIRGPGPTAVSSKFGYLLSGPICQGISSETNATILHVMTHVYEEVSKLQSYWDLETIGIKDDSSKSDINVDNFEIFRDTHLRVENGKYIARLPWKRDHPPLPTNYDITEKRTRAMVRKLTPELLQTYDKIINDQKSRNFIEEVKDDDNTRGHYLPHHSVKKDSITTPIRVVYDCSYKSRDSPSLNDCLETGPSLLNDLTSILLRFRVNRFALTSDIEKAFLQVGLENDDREFTKFMWLTDPSDPESPFTIYWLKVILFGAVSSPFILNAVVKTHLENNLDSSTANDLRENIYVDNIVTGTDNTIGASAYYNDATQLMNSCGFNLRSWASNCDELHSLARKDNALDSNSMVNVLGIRWLTESDQLTYTKKVGSPQPVSLTTKREDNRRLVRPPWISLSSTHKGKIVCSRFTEETNSYDQRLLEQRMDVQTDLSTNYIH